MKIQASVVVSKPAEEVFEAVTRPDVYLRRWSRGVLSVSRLPDHPTTPCTYQIIGRDIGKKVEWTYEVTDCLPYRRFAGRARGGSMAFIETFEIVPSPDGTTLRHIQELKPAGASRLLSPLMRFVWPHLMEDNLNRLKALVEKTPILASVA